jgi:hypothetical protein
MRIKLVMGKASPRGSAAGRDDGIANSVTMHLTRQARRRVKHAIVRVGHGPRSEFSLAPVVGGVLAVYASRLHSEN